METNKIDIIKGPSKEEMAKIYKSGGQRNVCFELEYGCKRTAYVDILEIKEVAQKHVKMLASIPAGFFMYSQGEDPRPDNEKLKCIKVYVFYTTNMGKGYMEKLTN